MYDFDRDLSDEADKAYEEQLLKSIDKLIKSTKSTMHSILFLIILIIGTTITILFLLPSKSNGAPAPTPKPIKPSQLHIPTYCTMIWGSTKYHTYFGASNYYQATDEHDTRHMWIGTWEILTEGDEKILLIKETHISPNSNLLTWRIILDRDMRSGKFMPHGGSFRIEAWK